MTTKLFLSTAAALFAGALAAQAADLPYRGPPRAPAYLPPTVYNWSGLYIGVNGGGAFGNSNHTDTFLGVATGDFDVSGGLVGGTVGFNYQVGAWVWGLEGDIDWANVKGTSGAFATAQGLTTYESELRWLSTFRGRLGYAWDRVLPYVTGGLAMGSVRGTVSNPVVVVTGTETQVGWTLGAGVEYAVTPNVSLKGEYLYVDLGTATPIAQDSIEFTTHVVRAGLNWKFDWGGARY
jgi:outer membrane immunogenic protein